jgi:hypothetical protein
MRRELIVVGLARRFLFVDETYRGETQAISCDGLVPGTALDLTHWQGNHTPCRFKADTSTEIALKFAASPEAAMEWAGAVVVNNHFDTDGLLSIWVLLDPKQAVACRDLLVAAAEAGDFDEWPAIDQGLWLDSAIRALVSGAPDDKSAYQAAIPQLPELIRNIEERRDLWGREWEQLQRAVAALGSGDLRATRQGEFGVLLHSPGQPESPGPLLARQFLPGARRYLLAFERAGGRYEYRYERPRYAWADTVVRPVLPAPDAATLAEALGPDWTDGDLPGMTGIIRTRRPVNARPDDILRRLMQLDSHVG